MCPCCGDLVGAKVWVGCLAGYLAGLAQSVPQYSAFCMRVEASCEDVVQGCSLYRKITGRTEVVRSLQRVVRGRLGPEEMRIRR